MIIQEFYDEFNNLSEARQKSGLKTLFYYLVVHSKDCGDIISDFLEIASICEGNDYFGTEGLDV